jgi:hypothetical protein
MSLHPAATTAEIASKRHAALQVEPAGWGLSAKLIVPAILPIPNPPAKSPRLIA